MRMTEPAHRREIAGHELVKVRAAELYRPYDRLVLRDPRHGRWIGTVLECESSGDRWRVTAIRCLPSCRVHRRRR